MPHIKHTHVRTHPSHVWWEGLFWTCLVPPLMVWSPGGRALLPPHTSPALVIAFLQSGFQSLPLHLFRVGPRWPWPSGGHLSAPHGGLNSGREGLLLPSASSTLLLRREGHLEPCRKEE